ncbi:C40 family peptidase [Paenisporosarcina sp. NPDC076898]|uniref:C40 family peptidase n=1 Tax=unclassified Paenisporosarcina TaxID=2642018 RepID=UPI003CFEA3BA
MLKVKMFCSLIILFSVLTFSSGAQAADSSNKIIDYADNYIGTPYQYGGTTPTAFDCSGYITYVFRKFGINLPRTTADIYKVGQSVSKSNLMPGDIVFFQTVKAGPSHAGIYAGNNQFIHTSTSRGVRFDNINDSYWGPKYLGAKRVASTSVLSATSGITLSTKPGQIGEIVVTKNINLWKRDANNKLLYVRVLKVGEKYRVYKKDNLYGGQYGLGANMYITNMPAHIKYTPLQ